VTFAAHSEWCTCEENASTKKHHEFTDLGVRASLHRVWLFCNAQYFSESGLHCTQSFAACGRDEFCSLLKVLSGVGGDFGQKVRCRDDDA
jgi:hypothetical protein